MDSDGEGYLTGVQAVEGGSKHSLALKNDGTVYAWGENSDGQLGINSNNDHTIPYQVHGLNNGQPPDNGLSSIADVAAGEFFSMALKNDGTTVYAWGDNSYDQIDGTYHDHHYPVQVGGIAGTTPPELTGAKSAICHKPGKPAEKTLNVSKSALEGHLGHGDTLGACSS